MIAIFKNLKDHYTGERRGDNNTFFYNCCGNNWVEVSESLNIKINK